MKIIIHKSLYHNDKTTDPKPGIVMHLITQLQLTGTMIDIQGETDKPTNSVKYFNTILSVFDGPTRLKNH